MDFCLLGGIELKVFSESLNFYFLCVGYGRWNYDCFVYLESWEKIFLGDYLVFKFLIFVWIDLVCIYKSFVFICFCCKYVWFLF